jgi:hypothetical protein
MRRSAFFRSHGLLLSLWAKKLDSQVEPQKVLLALGGTGDNSANSITA